MMPAKISMYEMGNYHDFVSSVLGRKRGESLSGAAFRTIRLNIAPSIEQEVARAMCAASGKDGDEQLRALKLAADKLWAAGYR